MSLHVLYVHSIWPPILTSISYVDIKHTPSHGWLVETAEPGSYKRPGRYLLIARFVRADLTFNQPTLLLTPKSIPTKCFEIGM